MCGPPVVHPLHQPVLKKDSFLAVRGSIKRTEREILNQRATALGRANETLGGYQAKMWLNVAKSKICTAYQ